MKSKVIKKSLQKLVSFFPGNIKCRQLLSSQNTLYSHWEYLHHRSSLKWWSKFFLNFLFVLCDIEFPAIAQELSWVELSERHTKFYRSEINLFIASFVVVVDFIRMYRNLIFFLHFYIFIAFDWSKSNINFCSLPCIFFTLNSQV